MKESMVTAKYIADSFKQFEKDIKELESALDDLRGSCWERNVESDERISVKILWQQLQLKRKEYEDFAGMKFKQAYSTNKEVNFDA